MLISVENLAFGYGDNLIFTDVGFSINEGERIGLIGANGEGKTTLIKLILGQLNADSGAIMRKNGLKIGYLEQNGGYESGLSVYGEMLNVFTEQLNSIEKLACFSRELSHAAYPSHEYDVLSAKIESLNKYIAANDCFNTEVKIKTVLNGLGFGEMYDRIIDTLSGGEKTRLKLARLLLEEPNLLILDEPTNHLDIGTLFWLEDYLQSFKGAILVVSHDRYFLDKIACRTLEIENKKVTAYSGNYSKYKQLKAEHSDRLLKEYEAQQKEREKLQTYVDKNIVRATTAKSAQSRVKQLEKMEIIEKPYIPPKPPSFKFEYDTKPYEQVLTIENLSLSRGGKILLDNASLSVKRGDKVAIVGENGTGKSTLLKEILSGNHAIKAGRFVKFSYYDQESGNLDGENTVLEELWARHTVFSQTEARSALARCGLVAEDMFKKVKSLSGGERAKLALCVMQCERGNVLVLDEPTNHMDFPAREALERSLKEFDGTVIFVSHDRYFISAIAERIVELENKKLNVYEGGYDNFTSSKKSAEAVPRQSVKKGSFRSPKERAQDERKKARIKELEAKIAQLELREREINGQLADPVISADYKKVNELVKELEGIKLQSDMFYKEYGDMI